MMPKHVLQPCRPHGGPDNLPPLPKNLWTAATPFELGEPPSSNIRYSRQLLNQTRLRKGNAFRTVNRAVLNTFYSPRKWKKVLAQNELEAYIQTMKVFVDPKILDSRKRPCAKPGGIKSHIAPYLLPRPLDKCELYDLEMAALNKQNLRRLDMQKKAVLPPLASTC